MAKVLISYLSATGNTKRMAELIGEGAAKAGGDVTVKPVGQTSADELVDYDAIILACAGLERLGRILAPLQRAPFAQPQPLRDLLEGGATRELGDIEAAIRDPVLFDQRERRSEHDRDATRSRRGPVAGLPRGHG